MFKQKERRTEMLFEDTWIKSFEIEIYSQKLAKN